MFAITIHNYYFNPYLKYIIYKEEIRKTIIYNKLLFSIRLWLHLLQSVLGLLEPSLQLFLSLRLALYVLR